MSGLRAQSSTIQTDRAGPVISKYIAYVLFQARAAKAVKQVKQLFLNSSSPTHFLNSSSPTHFLNPSSNQLLQNIVDDGPRSPIADAFCLPYERFQGLVFAFLGAFSS